MMEMRHGGEEEEDGRRRRSRRRRRNRRRNRQSQVRAYSKESLPAGPVPQARLARNGLRRRFGEAQPTLAYAG